MEIGEEQLRQIVEQAVSTADLAPSEIPGIDLYMDQVITIFEEKLSGNKRREEDKLLTKTMINNYSKAGIMQPVKGKKYTKAHILQMLLIYNLKQTLSLSDIQRLTQGLAEDTGLGTEALVDIYGEFLEQKEEQRQSFLRYFLAHLGEGPQPEGLCDLYQMVLSLSSMSNFLRLAAVAIIDAYFPEENKPSKEK